MNLFKTSTFLLPFAAIAVAGFTEDFESFAPGTLIDQILPGNGFTIDLVVKGCSGKAMIFDSTTTSASDPDLVTPGDGVNNDVAKGNVLIVSENGNTSDPNDCGDPNVIKFKFSPSALISSIGLLDHDEGARILVFKPTGESYAIKVPATSDNGYASIPINDVVSKINVKFKGSGAVTEIEYDRIGGYVAGTWADSAIRILDQDLNVVRSFPAGSTTPNGIATDGTLIYSGHFSTQEVIAYDFTGTEMFRWSATLWGLQGMELVDGELGVARGGSIDFFEPTTGTYIRSIPSQGSSTEGLAYDGVQLWQLVDASIYGVSPANGSVISIIPNAAAGCSFAGTGFTVTAPNELVLACSNGNWYRVSSLDGSVLDSGNNAENMYALKAIP